MPHDAVSRCRVSHRAIGPPSHPVRCCDPAMFLIGRPDPFAAAWRFDAKTREKAMSVLPLALACEIRRPMPSIDVSCSCRYHSRRIYDGGGLHQPHFWGRICCIPASLRSAEPALISVSREPVITPYGLQVAETVNSNEQSREWSQRTNY